MELLRQWMEEVTLPKSVDSAVLGGAHLTRLNRAYTPVVNLARLFLEHRTLQLAAGTTQTYSFVFDMNLLFESFIYGFLQRHRAGVPPPGGAAVAACTPSAGPRALSCPPGGFTATRSSSCRISVVKAHGAGGVAGAMHPLLIDTK